MSYIWHVIQDYLLRIYEGANMKITIKNIEQGFTEGKEYTVVNYPNSEEVEVVDDAGCLRRLFNHCVNMVLDNMED
jgi:hypothetical protein